MNQKTKKLIYVGIIGSAIGGVLTTIIIKGMGFVFGLAKSFAVAVWHGLNAKLQLPLWLLLIGSAWVLYTFYIIARTILAEKAKPKPHTHYFRDEFWGLTWRWDYSGRAINPPWCYCPSCDTMLVYSLVVPYLLDQMHGAKPEISISCEHCSRTLYKGEGDQEAIQRQIMRQIDRKIRTGEWIQVVERQQKIEALNRRRN